MSRNPEDDLTQGVDTLIVPRTRDLGGFEVQRLLPAPRRQMVGPFIFFDRVGPAQFVTGKGIDVLPHPHIGLATVTYLYNGEFQHRDSLGNDQMIHPNELNWMVAGSGVTHSERTSEATRMAPSSLFGIQTWVALPEEAEDAAPDFQHFARNSLPIIEDRGKSVRLILGTAWGEAAPGRTFSEMFYADARLDSGADLPMPDTHEDRAIYVTTGSVAIDGQDFDSGQMMVCRPGQEITVTAGPQGARLMLLGGSTMNGPRYIWWNFVASSKDKIEAAKEEWRKANWQAGHFSLPPGDDREFTPLP